MLAVIAAIGASFAWDFGGQGIAVIGPVPGGLPSIGLPDVSWSDMLALVPIAGSCFVMIVAQSAAAARAFALPRRERVDIDADILGLAMANAAAGVSGAFVVNGSPTQTAMAVRAGARSQVAQVVFAGVVALVLLFATGPLQYLPRCVLAGIVFTIAVGLIDVFGGSPTSARRAPANSRWPWSPRRRSRWSGWSRGSCWHSRCRCCGTFATATSRTRWCSRRTRQVAGSPRSRPRHADGAGVNRLPLWR